MSQQNNYQQSHGHNRPLSNINVIMNMNMNMNMEQYGLVSPVNNKKITTKSLS